MEKVFYQSNTFLVVQTKCQKNEGNSKKHANHLIVHWFTDWVSQYAWPFTMAIHYTVQLSSHCSQLLSLVCWVYLQLFHTLKMIFISEETSRLVFTARLRPHFRMPPSLDRCTPPRRQLNQNIPPSVVLLQQCHCRNRHRGKHQNLSPPSVLFQSSRIFLQYTGDTYAKKR